MKKLIAIVAVVLMLATTFATSVFAGPLGVEENPPIDVVKMTPTVDGVVNENEGWSISAYMNYKTLGFFWHVNPLTMDGEVRFAWDDNNIYYCAIIRDGLEATHEITGELIPAGYNSFIYSTGDDNIDYDGTDDATYGYNGDIFGFSIDPLGQFIEYGFTSNVDYAPRYLIGLFEGDVAKMYRACVNVGDITDQVQVAGHKTADGWHLEAAIPWDMIIKDIEEITFGEIVLDKADVLADGAHIRCAAMYHDRFYDPEAEEVATWGRFITTPTVMVDGTGGNGASSMEARALGINLYLTGASTGDDTTTAVPNTDETTTAKPGETTTAAEETSVQEVTDEMGNAVTDEKGNKVTQVVKVTKKPTSGKPTGGSSAQTFDMGIAVALGALAASGIGFVASKKRK